VILESWVNSDDKDEHFTWRAKGLSVLTQNKTH